MEELIKYCFDKNELITDIIFNRSGEIKIKITGDDFYLYFKNEKELLEYIQEETE